jgi:hypothetical protein
VVHRQELTIASPTCQTEHTVSTLKTTHIAPDLSHLARKLESQDLRIPRRRWVKPTTLQEVRSVERGGEIAHQEVRGTGLGTRNIYDLEDLHPTRLPESYSTHTDKLALIFPLVQMRPRGNRHPGRASAVVVLPAGGIPVP